MKEFIFSVPQKIIFGEGSLEKISSIAAETKRKHAYIISDPFLNKIGLVKKCADYLDKAGILIDTFTETEANPSVETIEKAVQAYKDCKADFLVAIGGGSPMDVAKAVGVVVTYGGTITDYEGVGKVPGEIVPLIAIPTTAGTGSEATAACVITDHRRNYKLSVNSPKLIPSYAVLDPNLITTAPVSVAAACGIDAIVHAVEAFISKAASPFSDAMAEQALELIGKNIRAYVSDRTNIEAAGAMQVGCLFAGIAFTWAKLGDVHALSHPVSAYYNVPHGVANAILLPTILEYNALADEDDKYFKIYNYIALTKVQRCDFKPEMLADLFRDVNKSFGIPQSLEEVGVASDKIEIMSEDAAKSPNIAVNPRSTTLKDICELYRKAL
jgi:alcohol dehydrogenase